MPIPTPSTPAAYIAWTGTDSQHTLNVQQIGASSQLANTGNYSNNGPALAFFKGSLYIAWTGSDNQLNVMSGFASKVRLFSDFWGKLLFCPKNQFD